MKEMPSTFLLLVSVTLFLNISVLITNLGLYWFAKSKHGPHEEDSCKILCLPVSESVICECNSKVLQSFLEEKYLQNKLHKKKNESGSEILHRMTSTMQNTPTAKLKGNSEPPLVEPTSRGKMTSLFSWRMGNDCHLSNGMRYRNGRLVVPVDGIYFVYGQLEISYDKAHNNSEKVYKIDVTKYNILRGEETLFSSFVPYTVFLSPMSATRDVYFSSSVRLKAQDELYIRVSNLKQLHNPSNNMIGVYML